MSRARGMSTVHTFIRIPVSLVEEMYTAFDQSISEGNVAAIDGYVGRVGLTMDELYGELGEITVEVKKRVLRKPLRTLDPAPAFIIQAILARLLDRARLPGCEIRGGLAVLRQGAIGVDTSGVPGLPKLWGAIDGTLQKPPRHLAAEAPPSYSFVPPPSVRPVWEAAVELQRRCPPGDDFVRPALELLAKLLASWRPDETIAVLAS